jgi:hypothetical protein
MMAAQKGARISLTGALRTVMQPRSVSSARFLLSSRNDRLFSSSARPPNLKFPWRFFREASLAAQEIVERCGQVHGPSEETRRMTTNIITYFHYSLRLKTAVSHTIKMYFS